MRHPVSHAPKHAFSFCGRSGLNCHIINYHQIIFYISSNQIVRNKKEIENGKRSIQSRRKENQRFPSSTCQQRDI